MRFPKPTTSLERAALESSFERIRIEWGFANSFGPTELLQHWQKAVQEIEGGYQLSIHDLTFDLSMRDLLEEIKDAVPLRLGEEIESALLSWDERFRQATQESDEPIEAGVEPNANEWWFRIPKHAGPDVERYLLDKGLGGRRRARE